MAQIPAVMMRGGTSKGLFVLADDLPADPAERDRLLLRAMGSPDARQIDGLGGAHPLTSKVAVVSRSLDDQADIDYLFLQVHVDRPLVSDGQNCGNMLAGVGPFAVEKGLISADSPETTVRIRMLNTGGIAVASFSTPNGAVREDGEARIDGVPGTGAPVWLDFADVAGATCGALLPTGNPMDRLDGVDATCIDNGMPVVLVRARDLNKTGNESPAELEADAALCAAVERIRLAAGKRMGLGDVTDKTVPKVSLLAPPRAQGSVATRTFIPHRVHQAIGVLGAASVAAGCRIPGSVADNVAVVDGAGELAIEHPSGSFTVDITLEAAAGALTVRRSVLLRTARKLMSGQIFVPDDPPATPR